MRTEDVVVVSAILISATLLIATCALMWYTADTALEYLGKPNISGWVKVGIVLFAIVIGAVEVIVIIILLMLLAGLIYSL